jgi:phospholipid transport system transporter-binding protein
MNTVRLPPLPPHFTHGQVHPYLQVCHQALLSASAATATWELPAGALQVFDSSVLAVCLSLQRQARAQGGQLVLLDCPERLKDLSVLYGVQELLAA